MRFTSPSRRALGLLAVSTIGLSTAVLGATGIASAEPIAAAEQGAPLAATAEAGTDSFTVEAGTCAVRWLVGGGVAGATDGFEGGTAGLVATTTRVEVGQSFELIGGDAGIPADEATPAVPATDGGDSSVTGVDFSIVAQGGSADDEARPANTVDTPEDIDSESYFDGTVAEAGLDDGAGAAIAFGVACPQTPATFVGLGTADGGAQFFFDPVDDPTGDPLNDDAAYQVSIDGGAFETVETSPGPDTSYDQRQFSLSGLTDGQTYSVRVRTSTSAGVSEPSAATEVMPYEPLGAPTDVVVTPGVSSARVTWGASASDTGTFDLAGYTVMLNGPEFGGMDVCRTEVDEPRECLIGLPAGVEFSVFVVATDTAQYDGRESAIVPTGVIAGPAVPSAVPTKDDGDIVGPAGPISAVTAGQTTVLQGAGFLANSTVQLSLFSAPVSLGTVVTDETGAFSATVTIPAGLSNGTHTLVAIGVAPDGSTRNLVITVTVSGGTTTVATAGLANTGFETSTSLTAGGLALLAGVGLMVGARRRKPGTEQ